MLPAEHHFEHDPDGPVNNYAYYIYGVAITPKTIGVLRTLSCFRSPKAFVAGGRPLYEAAYGYRHGGLFDLRPLSNETWRGGGFTAS